MDRLTSNKNVSDMNMVELAYNSCYAKDGRAWYRDYERDIDARKMAIQLLERFTDIPNEFTCDDDFDDFMIDSMQYGTDSMLGLIALLYRNLWAMADLRERLKKYEDTGVSPEEINETAKQFSSHAEELSEYRAIGTIDECREAMEKQKPQKPHIWGDGTGDDGEIIYDMYDCPNCEKSYEIDYNDYKYFDGSKKAEQRWSTYAGGWIPCSERLPERDGRYIACLGHACVCELTLKDKRWFNPYTDNEYIDVTAWQPLPEPYKGG